MMIDVVCAVILNKDKIFVTQRGKNMSLPLKWEFPGGKKELNESEDQCIRRELREELNINVKIVKRLKNYVHSYETIEINLIPYLVIYLSGEIQLFEHHMGKWISKEELSNLD